MKPETKERIQLFLIIAVLAAVSCILVWILRPQPQQLFLQGLASDFNPIVEMAETESQTIIKTYDVPMPEEYINLTVTIANEYELDPELVFAVMKQESNYDFLAKNGNCYGIMQIHSCNYDELKLHLGVNNLMDAEQNIQSGCYILAKLLDKYPLERALVCYNCGEYANDYQSTHYSRSILASIGEITE